MRQHLIVTGVDYEQAASNFQKAVKFRVYGDRRTQSILKNAAIGEDIRVTIMDVAAGEIATHELHWKNGKAVNAVSIKKSFEPVSKKSYEGHKFKAGQFKVMSITDAYSSAQTIGRTSPGTLAEFSIFSHAGMIGPILVNSYSETETGRDPSDKDGRGNIDFNPPNMFSAEVKLFRSAFSPSGYIWIWGCNFPDGCHSFLSKVERNSKYAPNASDETIFELNAISEAERTYLNIFIGDRLGRLLKEQRLKLTFGDIKLLACRTLTSCYAHQIAARIGIPAYAALPGTDAEYDALEPPLMAVNARFSRRFAFFKNHFGVQLSPERRNYGKFDPSFQCTLPTK